MRPKLLDLFCKAGGAARGYSLAGFDVTGVDIKPQPRYPYAFVCADALSLGLDFLRQFDAIHASPPCQFATELRHAPNGKEHANLIPQTRELLKLSGLPYVIENVRGARAHLIEPVTLCGSMFGLGAYAGDDWYELQRHRLFECSFPLDLPKTGHHHYDRVIGVYGGHVRCRAAAHGGRRTRDFVGFDKPALAAEAMGIDWMTMEELSEAIPPAYTAHIGHALLAHISASRSQAA